MRKLRLWSSEIWIVLCYCIGRALAVFSSGKHWVLMERGDDARDNGYFFYKYIKEKHPEQKVYYLIDRKSADYHKVAEDAVQFGSLKSYYLLASAERLVSSHYASGLPIMSSKLFRMLRLYEKCYFLQHGITKDALPTLYGKVAPMQLFVCGAKPEYEFVKDTFGHKEVVVQYTGFARFDNLHDVVTKRQVLVMPTWRMYVANEREFLKSDYFKYWQSFLQNQQLLDYLEDNKIDLVFYVHYGMQPYIKHFVAKSNRIIIARFEDYDVQTLLKESAVLVTDYSSVFFDFAYMRKPVVYYQFDEETFFGKHYQHGYFSYRDMGFGDVCTCEEDVVNSLLRIANNNMQMNARYTKRINGFFPLYDRNNCQRIYEFIAGDKK